MNITVYCGANSGNQAIFEQSAIAFGKWIAKNNNTLVYGGGKAGLMGSLADTVLHSGGEVIGVIPTFLKNRELAHPDLTNLYIVESMSERKNKMAELAEVFIALPGGPGTLEEITEMVSWARIGQNPNPCIFYNVNNYYDAIENFYDNMVINGFLTKEDRSKILFTPSFDEISSFIENYEPPLARQY
ncbi:TIGR00730 family Rossman fold protein [Tetragenococcus halophilus]|uniref:LOG family protein n=1 Tax=Tetragenococcus halophilus TaxID=51669 RepID=UPI001F2C7E3E|nr:TIGR00730 family Rossman fold protein [Tetragenococcus halophilus]MCF1685609.1 TIGR00730 family Rossman fold protein [Tetragenococcus halophilus]